MVNFKLFIIVVKISATARALSACPSPLSCEWMDIIWSLEQTLILWMDTDIIGGVTERTTAPGRKMSWSRSARNQRKKETFYQFKTTSAFSVAKFPKKRVDKIFNICLVLLKRKTASQLIAAAFEFGAFFPDPLSLDLDMNRKPYLLASIAFMATDFFDITAKIMINFTFVLQQRAAGDSCLRDFISAILDVDLDIVRCWGSK